MQTLPLLAWPDNIHALDAGYVRPGLAAVHLIIEKGRVAVVDTAHNAALPRFLAALSQLGLAPEAVDYVFLTHVHLDHAGGAGAYMAQLPNAKLVVHPRGARHMIDPARLLKGTVEVYGAEKARRLYGEPMSVPPEKVIEADDGQVFALAGRSLRCLHTPGHARHHLCLWDERARACFTGDAFGIAYREMGVSGDPFIIPATTPTQFDPEAMKASIHRLLALAPEAMYLTHFSRIDDVARLGADLLRRIDAFASLAEAAPGEGKARKEAIHARIERYLLSEAPAESHEWLKPVLAVDMELDAQGLAWWREHR
jgi:hydroxyacylglutathione hydrolase